MLPNASVLGGPPCRLPEGVIDHLLRGLPGWLQSQEGWKATGRLRETGSFPLPFAARTEAPVNQKCKCLRLGQAANFPLMIFLYFSLFLLGADLRRSGKSVSPRKRGLSLSSGLHPECHEGAWLSSAFRNKMHFRYLF